MKNLDGQGSSSKGDEVVFHTEGMHLEEAQINPTAANVASLSNPQVYPFPDFLATDGHLSSASDEDEPVCNTEGIPSISFLMMKNFIWIGP